MDLKAQFADEKAGLMEEQRKVVTEFESKIERVKEDHNNATRTIRYEHDEKTKSMTVSHEKEIAELRASMGAASGEELLRLKAKHAEDLKE